MYYVIISGIFGRNKFILTCANLPLKAIKKSNIFSYFVSVEPTKPSVYITTQRAQILPGPKHDSAILARTPLTVQYKTSPNYSKVLIAKALVVPKQNVFGPVVSAPE